MTREARQPQLNAQAHTRLISLSFFYEDLLVVVGALLITLMTTLLRPHSPDLSFFVCFDHVVGCWGEGFIDNVDDNHRSKSKSSNWTGYAFVFEE